MIERDDDYYYINGKCFDRVHKVLKVRYNETLVDWQIREGKTESERKMQERQDIGTEVHSCISQINKGKIYNEGEWNLLSSELQNGTKAWIQAKRTLKFEVEHCNLVVYSEKYRVAGEIDELHRHTDKYLLSDNKTSKELWLDGRLQLGAYYLLGMTSHRDIFKKITGGRLLRLDTDTGEWYEKRDIKEMTKDELIDAARAFVGLIVVMRFQEKYEVKRNGHSSNQL